MEFSFQKMTKKFLSYLIWFTNLEIMHYAKNIFANSGNVLFTKVKLSLSHSIKNNKTLIYTKQSQL